MNDADYPNMPPPSETSKAPVVMQVLPSLVTGGVERGAVDIAAALKAAGWGSIVVSSGGPMVREVERAGAEHIQLPTHSKNPLVIRANIARLAALVRSRGVDIVHARSRAPAWSAEAAARQTGAHFVTTFHATYNFRPAPKRWYNAVMTRGERIIAISDHIRRHIVRVYGVDPDRLRVIYRGIDFDLFDPQAVPPARVIKLATDWRLPDGIPVVMLPGRLTRWKGQAVLIEALARLGHDRVRCLLVGDEQGRSGYRRELEDLIARHRLQSVVHMTGPVGDMPAAYKLADVVVSASTDPEAFGRVMVEAQAMGRPVIAADHGSSRELVEPEGGTGWLVGPGDPDALAQAINTAIHLDTAAREALADRAIARVRQHFSKHGMCSATLAVYREVLSETQPQLGAVAA